MDPFEYFQQLRPRIEKDDSIMKNLREYAFGDRWSLTNLGRGTSNIHFRLGEIEGLWLASREFEPETWVADGKLQRIFAESYIDQLVAVHQSGKRVPILCGGVKVEYRKKETKHFMLLEDITKGGSQHFIARRGVYGEIDGAPIFHDFPEQGRVKSFKYMTNDKMIVLKE